MELPTCLRCVSRLDCCLLDMTGQVKSSTLLFSASLSVTLARTPAILVTTLLGVCRSIFCKVNVFISPDIEPSSADLINPVQWVTLYFMLGASHFNLGVIKTRCETYFITLLVAAQSDDLCLLEHNLFPKPAISVGLATNFRK